MDKVKIVALGGLDEDGKDLYCIEINDTIIVVGGGFKYPTKTTPGIDFIIANFDYLKNNKSRVKAFILPKSKKNSFGALPYIYKEVQAPIYGTKLTYIFLKDFAKKYGQDSDFDFHEITLPFHGRIAGFEMMMFSTCASMPNTFGFSIKTNIGNIVYSGDFIVEYSNTSDFKLDLNTLGKIAENPTLLLMSESVNSPKHGYCTPNNKLSIWLEKYFKEAKGRIFISISSNNLYHANEVFTACMQFNKKIYFYDEMGKNIFSLRKYGYFSYFPTKSIIDIDDILRTKESELVILMCNEGEKIYDEISILASRENKEKQIKITSDDTFIVACPPLDNIEVVATSTIDELYKTGCKVEYVSNKMLNKMHAYEEDLKMLISLLKPKYYLPIEGYYVNLLANAKLAMSMNIGLTHTSIFLLDNGQSLSIDEKGTYLDFYKKEEIPVGDVMIDGIGVGDVVNEIINERARLSEDGVLILGCAISKKERKIITSPDIQMRGFLFLKDKEADAVLKEATKILLDDVSSWALSSKDFNTNTIQNQINGKIARLLLKENNRNPVVRTNIIVIE